MNSLTPESKTGFTLINHGGYFYRPPENLARGLKKLIIFPENEKRHEIPNGSVWVYDTKMPFNPGILNADAGCGMCAFLTERIDFSDRFIKELARILTEDELSIGRGNHFIDFCEGHPNFRGGNLVVLHSNFNKEQNIPKTFYEAAAMIERAKRARAITLKRLLDRLRVAGEFYQDWPHNTVETKNGSTIYRKGAVDTSKTQNEGMLALNPYDGFYFYISRCHEFCHSMQHGAGKKTGGNSGLEACIAAKEKKVRIYSFLDGKRPPALYDEFNDGLAFYKKYGDEHFYKGISTAKVVARTD